MSRLLHSDTRCWETQIDWHFVGDISTFLSFCHKQRTSVDNLSKLVSSTSLCRTQEALFGAQLNDQSLIIINAYTT